MKAPKLPSFFKSAKNKQFDLPVRYYNERKERVQQARDNAEKKENGGSNLQKGRFSTSWKKNSTMATGSSSLRVAIIIVILCFIAYWIIKY